MEKQKLIVSETFYSIQGEGACAGKPAVFLRLAGCNLRCKGFSYQDPISGEHLGCDTALVWRTGKQMTCSDIISHWQQQGWLNALNNGAHLVLTGGEPLIHQAKLIQFIQLLDRTCTSPPFIELETNATLPFNPTLLSRLNQVNASPKLAHSGENDGDRYKEKTLHQLSHIGKVKFKFVLAHQSDITEVLTKFVGELQIPPQRIWLMPEGGTREAINSKSAWLVELCKQHRMHYSPRLQVSIWGEVTGV